MPYIAQNCPDCDGTGLTKTLGGQDMWCFQCAGTGRVERHELDSWLEERIIRIEPCNAPGCRGGRTSRGDSCYFCKGFGAIVYQRGCLVGEDSFFRSEWQQIREYVVDMYTDGRWER